MRERLTVHTPLDTSYCSKLASERDSEKINRYLKDVEVDGFNRLFYLSEGDGESLLVRIITALLIRVSFDDPNDFMYTVSELNEDISEDVLQELGKHIIYHTKSISVKQYLDFHHEYDHLSELLIFRYFNSRLEFVILGQEIAPFTDDEIELAKLSKASGLIHFFFSLIRCKNIDTFLDTLSRIQNLDLLSDAKLLLEPNHRDDESGFKYIQCDGVEYLVDATQQIEECREIGIPLIRLVASYVNKMLESAHYNIHESTLIQYRFDDMLAIETFRYFLQKHCETSISASVLKKYIDARWSLTSNRTGATKDYLATFSEKEGQLVCQFDSTYIQYLLNKNVGQLVMQPIVELTINLLFAIPEADTGYSPFNIKCSQDEGELYCYPSELIENEVDIGMMDTDEFFEVIEGIDEKLRSIKKVDACAEPFSVAESPSDDHVLSLHKLVIDKCVRSDEFVNEALAKQFTKTCYQHLSNSSGVMSDSADYEQLTFFHAFYTPDNDIEKREELYKRTLQFDGGYANASLHNLLVLCIDNGDEEQARYCLGKLDEDHQDWIDKFTPQVKALEKRVSIMKPLFESAGAPKNLGDLSIESLLYLSSVVISVLDMRADSLIHDNEKPFSWLVADYDVSSLLVSKLISEKVLVPLDNSWKTINKASVTMKDITSIPLVPNIKGFVTYELLLVLCKDEVRRRDINPKEVNYVNIMYKAGWLYNTLHFNIKKRFDGETCDITQTLFDEVNALIVSFSPSVLGAIAWNAINFVAGSMQEHGFGKTVAFERIPMRLKKVISDSRVSGYKAKTFERNQRPTLPVETVLMWVDGIPPNERYNSV
jgi:hypothetical protein